MRSLIVCIATVCVLASSVCLADGDFVEKFSLAEDREQVLKELIPGTEDYYYYHCLHYQNTGELGQVDEMLKTWIERHKRTGRVREIQNRQALLRYDENPTASLNYIRGELGLYFGHEREVLGKKSTLPTSLDQGRISRKTLTRNALSRSAYNKSVRGFEDSALDWLIDEMPDSERRRDLLQRLKRPDYWKLPQVIVDDLNARNSRGFGGMEIHRRLLLGQLDELLRLKPDLLNKTNFVNTYLTKLYPNPDVDWQHDEAEREAYLERIEAFTSRLNASHNSLKAHAIHHRLVHDRAKGVYDKERFMEYIKLPRRTVYMSPVYMKVRENQNNAANLSQDFRGQTRLPIIGNDEALVRGYLQHFFVNEESYRPYEKYLNDIYLKEVFAETKILHGLGDMETWYSWLSPAKYRALKDRIDLDFDPANKALFDVDEAVSLDLWVKNVETLIVKVFDVNTQNYYRSNLREVNTDIDLDGLVANEENVYTYDAVPLRRVKRSFGFENLDRRGVYVIEFIGNGKSSRALIRKGRLNHLVRTGAAGHVFTILDESNKQVDGATIWLSGHEYSAGENGKITVPFSQNPGRQPIIITHGAFSSLDFFQHQSENYSLVAGIHIDRESLRKGETAQVAVRPALYVNGIPTTLAVLEEPTLLITSTDRQGISTTKEVRDFELFNGELSVYEFRVPDDLSEIVFTLKGKVENMSRSKKEDLAVSRAFALNHIDKTEQIEAVHLSRADGEYLLEVLGKTGERLSGRPVNLVFKHRDFKDEVHQTLQTDADGVVDLGELKDIVHFSAKLPNGQAGVWYLVRERHSYPASVHGKAGEAIQIPYMGTASKALRSEFSFLEQRAGTYVADRFESLGIKDGFLTLGNLPAGDYELYMKSEGRAIGVRVTQGDYKEGNVVSDYRRLEVKNSKPLQIQAVDVDDEEVRIRIANHSQYSRVHVAATRFMPAYSFYSGMSVVTIPEPYVRTVPKAESVYIAGRKIGEEYQYILDRKYAKVYPGNSLDRPGLLINPWAIRKTETARQDAAAGEAPMAAPAPGAPTEGRAAAERDGIAGTSDHVNLDFLSGDAVVLLNLEVDDDGYINIAREALNGRQQLHIVAVDPANTAYRELSLEDGGIAFKDLRLENGLDPEQHLTEQKRISSVEAGGELSLSDVTTSKYETYDTVAKVYKLYASLSNNSTLAEFGFVTRWPELSGDERLEFYSKYACHELNFFLYRKDPEFFESVVLPFIENKRDKTFLDEWLVGDNLGGYLKPWAYQQLNIVERILLAERTAGESGNTKRHVTDLYNLLPPDIERFNHLFTTALKGKALDVREGLALGFDTSSLSLMGEDRRARASTRYSRGKTDAFAERPAAESSYLMRMPSAAQSMPEDEAGIKAYRDTAMGRKKEKAGGLEEVSVGGAIRIRANLYDFDEDLEERKKIRQLYQKLDKTQEWVENNYYKLPIEQQNAGLITVNAFWRDYAGRVPNEKFLSTNLAEASRNFPEMMFALAVLDLPFEADEHEAGLEGRSWKIDAASPMVVFHKEILDAGEVTETTPILVSQNFFAHGDRYIFENNEKTDKFVTDEFLAYKVYGCQVAVTNPTSSRQKLDVLLQIPEGALPVLNGKYTDSVHLDLQPYNTTAIEYHFYYPQAGDFRHYPVHVARNGKLIAYAQPAPMHVVYTPTTVDTTSWDYISQHGSAANVIDFLEDANLHRLNLERIAWRMKERPFFEKLTTYLDKAHAFNLTLWGYGIYHNDTNKAREFLQYQDNFVRRCGDYIDTSLLTIDPVVRKSYQHMEYSPLVNARAHKLGSTRKILNDRFAQQYARLMKVLTYRSRLDDDDLMAVTYYMLLQDRVEEGLAFFGRVQGRNLDTQLQYDYLTAYLCFYGEELGQARVIAAKYEDYPVERWQKMFANVRSQLAEIDGAETDVVDDDSRAQRQAKLASTEPNFEFKVEAKRVEVNYQNVSECQVNYYLMDIELLFSRNPFVQQYSDRFSTIKPNFSETISLDADGKSYTFDLPERFRNSNVMVEIEAGGIKKSEAYYANNLALQVVENYGQIKVTHKDTGKVLSKVYVKVFARMQDGRVRFYKDGYTDLRGRFDYTSLNTNELDFVDRFSLLVMSDTDGAVVREAAPPKR